MLIRMLAPCILQEAGRERPLSLGQVYDLSETVVLALIESGAAEYAVRVPLETKPAAPYETKVRKRRA